jgi:uncharacterized protein YuzE
MVANFKRSIGRDVAADDEKTKRKAMKIHYDPQVDALYLRLSDAAILDSEEVRPSIVLDYDENNRVVGIEVLSLKKHLPDADVDKFLLELPSAPP